MARLYTLTVLSLSVVVALVSCCSASDPDDRTTTSPPRDINEDLDDLLDLLKRRTTRPPTRPPARPRPVYVPSWEVNRYRSTNLDPTPLLVIPVVLAILAAPYFAPFVAPAAPLLMLGKRDVDDNAEENARRGLTDPEDVRRRWSTDYMDYALLDERASRKLFHIFDLDNDGRIDVVDWKRVGGKPVSFSDLIVAYDMDGDEKLSLEEFLRIHIVPEQSGLGRDDIIKENDEASPNPGQD